MEKNLSKVAKLIVKLSIDALKRCEKDNGKVLLANDITQIIRASSTSKPKKKIYPGILQERSLSRLISSFFRRTLPQIPY